MILLLGGTSETALIAETLACAGYGVLVSTATKIPLDTGRHSAIKQRTGRMTEKGMVKLIRENGVRALVVATHPYASEARETAFRAAEAAGIYHAAYVRPGVLCDKDGVRWAGSHEEAAVEAFKIGKPVLLTTGSKNLTPYAREAARTGIALFARVLPQSYSIAACHRAGIPENRIITGKGPFSVEENLRQINNHGIGVLVTKDSGEAGGVPEKMKAAQMAGCAVVAVARPELPSDNVFEDIPLLVKALTLHVKRCG
jgi:precorrin-6A/cobalt-precorrin-6A reductase